MYLELFVPEESIQKRQVQIFESADIPVKDKSGDKHKAEEYIEESEYRVILKNIVKIFPCRIPE
jgi:hypothetical protein